MMNQTRVLQHIEMMLGVPFQALEIDEDEIMDIIRKYTLPTFSKFYPLYITVPVRKDEDEVGENTGMYYLNSELTILGISKLLYQGMNMFDHSTLPSTTFNPVLNKIRADQYSAVTQPVTFQFHAPNVIEVFPKRYVMPNFTVELKVVHPDHLITIPENMHDEFLKLCTIDVKIALYPIRHRFQNINTTFGNIELFLDKFESAQDDREQLIEKWQQTFYKNSKRRKMFVY